VDGIRITRSSGVTVTNCLIENLSGTGISGVLSAVQISQSVINHCRVGVATDPGSSSTNFNNTIVECVTGLQGNAAVAYNLIVWSNQVSLTNWTGPLTFSDVEMFGTNLWPGAGNLNRQPWFRNVAERDYSLLDISPCREAGADGGPMGAVYPVGANPAAPRGLTVTGVTASTVALAWIDGSPDEEGFEIQRSLDGIFWLPVTNVAADVTTWIDSGLQQTGVTFTKFGRFIVAAFALHRHDRCRYIRSPDHSRSHTKSEDYRDYVQSGGGGHHRIY